MTMLNRRALIASAAATAAAAHLPARAQAPAAPTPPAGGPVARVQPVTDVVHGVTTVDPYRWMESMADPEWEPFMRGQDAHTRGVLAAMPGRAAMLARMQRFSGAYSLTTEARRAGPWVFITRRPEGAQTTKLFVRRGLEGEDRLLIDTDAMRTADSHVSMSWWEPSPDGDLVAYGLATAGREQSTLHVMETATGRVRPDRVPRVDFGIVSWLPDSSGLFYHQLGREGQTPLDEGYNDNSKTWLHRLGRPAGEDVQVLGSGLIADMPIRSNQLPVVFTAPGSTWAVAAVINGVENDSAIYAAPLEAVVGGSREWRRVADFPDQVTQIAQRGDEIAMLTYKDAPRWKVMYGRLDQQATFASAATVVPESERVIQSLHAAADGLYLLDMDGGPHRLRRLDDEGELHDIAFPLEGGLASVDTDPREPGALVFSESKAEPTALFRVADDRAVRTEVAPRPRYPTDFLQQTRIMARVRDGTEVPITLLHRRGYQPGGDAPVIVNAYGAYGVVEELFFSPRQAAWVDAGGVWATAHVRGGGDYGRPWHLAGRKATKPNTWRDLIDCCEHLVAERWAPANKLAILGGSAGGITVGMAMIERPDLFTAVIAGVGMHNTARIGAIANGPGNFPEFGDPAVAEEYRGLLAMDSYLAVRDGAPTPAALITCGMNDRRVPAWLPAKFAARVQAAKAPGDAQPTLLRVEFEAGHGIGSTRDQTDALQTDVYSFVLWRTGDPAFQPAA